MDIRNRWFREWIFGDVEFFGGEKLVGVLFYKKVYSVVGFENLVVR